MIRLLLVGQYCNFHYFVMVESESRSQHATSTIIMEAFPVAINSNNSIIQCAILSVKNMLNYFTIMSNIDFIIMIRVVPRRDFWTRHGRTKKIQKRGWNPRQHFLRKNPRVNSSTSTLSSKKKILDYSVKNRERKKIPSTSMRRRARAFNMRARERVKTTLIGFPRARNPTNTNPRKNIH